MHSLQVVHMSMQRYDLCWMHYSYSTLPNTLLNFLEVLFCFNFHNFLWQLYLTAFVICIVNVYACITKITSRKNDFDFNGGLWLWKVVSELGKRSNIIIISQSISHPAYSGYGMKYPLVLHAKPLVRAIEWVEIWSPGMRWQLLLVILLLSLFDE